MRKKDYSRAMIFGLSMSGALAAMAALTVRLLMIGLGLDLFLRILGSSRERNRGEPVLCSMFGRVAPSVVLALVLFASNSPANERLQNLTGRTVAEVLAILQSRGLQIIDSTALIHDSMLVEREPRAMTPRGILEEIVAPHGLELRDGPGRTLLIVPAERTKPEPPQLPVFLHEITVTPSHRRSRMMRPTRDRRSGRRRFARYHTSRMISTAP